MSQIVSIGRIMELGKRQEKILKGESSRTTRETGKGKTEGKKETTVTPRPTSSKPDLQDLRAGERFRRVTFGRSRTPAAQAEWKRMLGDTPQAIIDKRKKDGVCWRCGTKGHVAYACNKEKPIISAIGGTKRPREDDSQPETKRVRLTSVLPKEENNSEGRIWEMEENED